MESKVLSLFSPSNNLLVNVKKKPGNKNKLLHPKFVTDYKTDRYCQLKMGCLKTTRKLSY